MRRHCSINSINMPSFFPNRENVFLLLLLLLFQLNAAAVNRGYSLINNLKIETMGVKDYCIQW